MSRLKRGYPDDPTTAALVGQDRLRRCIGEPWALVLKDSRGADVELARLRGEPAMVLFFASWDPLSRNSFASSAAGTPFAIQPGLDFWPSVSTLTSPTPKPL